MKKLIGIIAILIAIVLLLTGCVNKQKREEILKSLEKEEYIKEEWNLIDTYNDVGILGIDYYNYIYEDENEKLYNVSINANSSENEKISVYISKNIEKSEIENPNYGKKGYENEGKYKFIYKNGEIYERLVLEEEFFGWKIDKK